MNSRPSSLNPAFSSGTILNRSEGELAPIIKTIHRLQRLNDLLEKILPAELRKHCQIANLDQGKLLLSFDSSVWASKFHFEKNEYVSAFRGVPEFAGIIQINHRVDPHLFIPPPKKIEKTQAFKLSTSAQHSLEQLMLNSEGKLRASLEKLQGRLKSFH